MAGAGETDLDPVSVVAGAVDGGVLSPRRDAAPTAASPVAKRLLIRAQKGYSKRRFQRLQALLDLAARFAGVPIDDLVKQLESSAARERLLIDTLLAAQDEGDTTKLLLFAESLAITAASSGRDLLRERLIVAALADLDREHLDVLASYADAGAEPRESRGDDIEEFRDALVGALQHHGFVTAGTPSITVLGQTVIDRRRDLDMALERAQSPR